MNSASSILPSSLPADPAPAGRGAQSSAPPGTSSSPANAKPSGFAAAMTEAAKPALRRNGIRGAVDGAAGGAGLPPAGNQAPLPAAPPPPVTLVAAAAAQAAAAAAAASAIVAASATAAAQAAAAASAGKSQAGAAKSAAGAVRALAPGAQSPSSVTSPSVPASAACGAPDGKAVSLEPDAADGAAHSAGAGGDGATLDAAAAAQAAAATKASASLKSGLPAAGRADATPKSLPTAARNGGVAGIDGNGAQVAGGAPTSADAAPAPNQAAIAADAAARSTAGAQAAAAQTAAVGAASQDDDGAPPAGSASPSSNRKATMLANLGDTAAAADPDPAAPSATVPAVPILTAPIIAAALDGAGGKHAHGEAAPTVDAAAGALSMTGAAPAAVVAAPPASLKLDVNVGSPDFPQALADKVSWMVDQNVNGAKLQVNPPQLGPIEVRITVQGDRAQVWLSAHSSVTREALEAGSPKLREMLGGQGFAQVSVDVSQRSFQERTPHAQAYQWEPPAEDAPLAQTGRSDAGVTRAASGSLDAYA